jgi:hypothetical protein
MLAGMSARTAALLNMFELSWWVVCFDEQMVMYWPSLWKSNVCTLNIRLMDDWPTEAPCRAAARIGRSIVRELLEEKDLEMGRDVLRK